MIYKNAEITDFKHIDLRTKNTSSFVHNINVTHKYLIKCFFTLLSYKIINKYPTNSKK